MTERSALVVDDSRSARFALRRELEGRRYRVDAVESVDAAMRLLAGALPDVIFLDHVMPGVDGFDALTTMKADARLASIPAVICSSNEGMDFDAKARAAGASGVLQKPPDPMQLAQILERLEGGSSSGASPDRADDARAVTAAQESPSGSSTPAPPRERAPSAAPSPLPEDTLLREQLESRLRKVSQGLSVQFAEIRGTLAHLSSLQAQLAERQHRVADQPQLLRQEFGGALDRSREELRIVSTRVEDLERETSAQLAAMRTRIDAALDAQAERVDGILQSALHAAAEEARIVAERTVTAAALRISDQLADAILGAVARR